MSLTNINTTATIASSTAIEFEAHFLSWAEMFEDGVVGTQGGDDDGCDYQSNLDIIYQDWSPSEPTNAEFNQLLEEFNS